MRTQPRTGRVQRTQAPVLLLKEKRETCGTPDLGMTTATRVPHASMPPWKRDYKLASSFLESRQRSSISSENDIISAAVFLASSRFQTGVPDNRNCLIRH